MSKLYSNQDLVKPTMKLTYASRSLLRYVSPLKLNKSLPPLDRFTIYNSGSKCSAILLCLLTQGSSYPSNLPSDLKAKFSLN